MALSHQLAESEWLSNKNNAIKILVWCIGSSYLATLYANSIDYYVVMPITGEYTRRIRMSLMDQEKYYSDVPCSILSLASSNDSGSTKQFISNSSQSFNNNNNNSGFLEYTDVDCQNDIIMELLLSFVKEHDTRWFSNRFCRQLVLVSSSSHVCFWIGCGDRRSHNWLSYFHTAYFEACILRRHRRVTICKRSWRWPLWKHSSCTMNRKAISICH